MLEYGLPTLADILCCWWQMSALGETIPPGTLVEVEKLQTACRNRQVTLTKSFEELSEKLSRATVVAQFVVAQRHREKAASRKRNLYGHQERVDNPMIAG